jgi:hypothetical protein
VEEYSPQTQRGYAATKLGIISRKGAKTQRKTIPNLASWREQMPFSRFAVDRKSLRSCENFLTQGLFNLGEVQ